jgi:hypothetical protein
VRPAAQSATVRVGLRLWTSRAGAVRVRVERALGTGGRDRCPPAGSPGRFDGRYRTVSVVRSAASAADPRAPVVRLRRITLRLRLAPALYRLTVTTGGVSKRRFLRVLMPPRRPPSAYAPTHVAPVEPELLAARRSPHPGERR